MNAKRERDDACRELLIEGHMLLAQMKEQLKRNEYGRQALAYKIATLDHAFQTADTERAAAGAPRGSQ